MTERERRSLMIGFSFGIAGKPLPLNVQQKLSLARLIGDTLYLDGAYKITQTNDLLEVE